VNAQLIESDDEHHWVLLDHRVTQLVIDRSSIRLQTWSLEGSADIRLAAPFAVNLASGATRRIDPADTERLAPCLALVGLGVRSVTVTRTGTLTLAFSDGSSIAATPDPRRQAWDVQGGGILEGMAYAGEPGVELW
jgi:invasion protein IalB